MRLAANLTMLFTEYPFLERFDRARDAGFDTVEFFFPYGLNHNAIGEALRRNELELCLFNLPLGDWDAGERGFVAQPARRADFATGLGRALDSAALLHPAHINTPSGPAPEAPESREALVGNLRLAAQTLADAGVGLVMEPINRIDVPGAYISTVDRAIDVIDEVGHPNLQIQYDTYHSVRAGEDPLAVLTEHLPRIGHIQISDVPGRHEPGSGNVDFPRLFQLLDERGYPGWVSLEYHPSSRTENSFGFLKAQGFLGS